MKKNDKNGGRDWHEPPFGSKVGFVKKTTKTAELQLTRLINFRQAAYDCFTHAGDALFELLDALLLSPQLASFPELSCVPVFRRGWPSLYQCLQDGGIDEFKELCLCLNYLPASKPPLLVGDSTAWPRLYTETLEDCSIQHRPTPIAIQKPITVGYGFSTLGLVPEEKGSWFLPLLHERIKSESTPSEKAAQQLETVVPLLAARPLALYDSGYGSGVFFKRTSQIECDLLVRVKPHRKLYRRPPPYSGLGRPALHGAVLRLKEPSTWGRPDEEIECKDPSLGRVRAQCWHDLHFEDAPQCPVDLIRIERLDARGTKRDPKVIWLARREKQRKPLAECWRSYLRRYTVEHWYRFIKRNLHWTLPALSTPVQSQLWSNLVVLAYWQIFLARQGVKDQPRPWQKPLLELTPGRVQQGLGAVLARIGTPAQAPKPRGKSPGWEKGRGRTKRTRYPLVKKHHKKPPQTVSDTS